MKLIRKNKKARYDYEILETYEAGIVLNGQEVKSIKQGRISLKGSYVKEQGEEIFLVGANVPAYQPANAPDDYNPKRRKKLLLRKEQIKRILGKSKQSGLTMVPLSVYTKKGKIKLKIGLAKGKKKHDKRKKIKKRDAQRKIERKMKKKYRRHKT